LKKKIKKIKNTVVRKKIEIKINKIKRISNLARSGLSTPELLSLLPFVLIIIITTTTKKKKKKNIQQIKGLP